MQQQPATSAPAKARRPGRPRQITREQIVEAGAALGLENLTVRAVSEKLNVTRAAVYNYIRDSDELRRAVAGATMADFAFDVSDATDWQTLLTRFAKAFRSWRLAQPDAAQFVTLREIESVGVFVAVEFLLATLVEAGFAEDVAPRALEFLSGVVWINTHDQLLALSAADGVHPQQTQLQDVIESLGAYPRMQRLVANNEVYGVYDARFEFEVRGVIRALEAELASTRPAD
jgi:AcrR family transcriptional regulator